MSWDKSGLTAHNAFSIVVGIFMAGLVPKLFFPGLYGWMPYLSIAGALSAAVLVVGNWARLFGPRPSRFVTTMPRTRFGSRYDPVLYEEVETDAGTISVRVHGTWGRGPSRWRRTSVSVGGRDVHVDAASAWATGDAAFDAAMGVSGDDERVVAALDAAGRKALLRLLNRGWSLDEGRFVTTTWSSSYPRWLEEEMGFLTDAAPVMARFDVSTNERRAKLRDLALDVAEPTPLRVRAASLVLARHDEGSQQLVDAFEVGSGDIPVALQAVLYAFIGQFDTALAKAAGESAVLRAILDVVEPMDGELEDVAIAALAVVDEAGRDLAVAILKRCGTAKALMPLEEAADRAMTSRARKAITDVAAEIRARLPEGSGAGQLALSAPSTEEGGLSVPVEEGQLSPIDA